MSKSSTLHLVTRHTTPNPNHHLWSNNGTWWCHFTLRPEGGRSTRVRTSLRTRDLELARQRRDRILSDIRQASGRIAG